MKKFILLFVAIILLFTACSNDKYSTAMPTSEPIPTNIENTTPTPKPTAGGFTYVHSKQGYVLQFPKSWNGRYRTSEGDYSITLFPIDAPEQKNDLWLFTLYGVPKDDAYRYDTNFLFLCETDTHMFYLADRDPLLTIPESLDDYTDMLKDLKTTLLGSLKENYTVEHITKLDIYPVPTADMFGFTGIKRALFQAYAYYKYPTNLPDMLAFPQITVYGSYERTDTGRDYTTYICKINAAYYYMDHDGRIEGSGGGEEGMAAITVTYSLPGSRYIFSSFKIIGEYGPVTYDALLDLCGPLTELADAIYYNNAEGDPICRQNEMQPLKRCTQRTYIGSCAYPNQGDGSRMFTDTVGYLYSTSRAGSGGTMYMYELYFNDDGALSGDGVNMRVGHYLYAGNTYYVMVRGYSPSTTGYYNLTFQQG